MLRLLFAHGARANVDGKASGFTTPLIEAANSGNVDAVGVLLDHGADVNGKGAFYDTAMAAAIDHADIVQLLIERGAAVNAASVMGETPLMKATSSLNVEAVRLLLGHGADVNAQDGIGRTALMIGVDRYPYNELLNQRTWPAQSGSAASLHSADNNLAMRAERTLAIIRLLVEHGADPGIIDRNGQSAAGSARFLPTQVRDALQHNSTR